MRIGHKRRWVAVIVLGAVAAFPLIAVASAAPGTVLRTLTLTPSGNGRAVAVNPATDTLWYTNAFDPNIYVRDRLGAVKAPGTLATGINMGALAWDPTGNTVAGGTLWGGAYNASGNVYTINPTTGAPTLRFTCLCLFGPFVGFIDGLAYDAVTNTLWLSGDQGSILYHYTTAGVLLGTTAIPKHSAQATGPGFNTGIAVDGHYLWLALFEPTGQIDVEVVRVAQSAPTVVLSRLALPGTGALLFKVPEDIEFDAVTFTPAHCALWANHVNTGGPTVIKAYELEQGINAGCPIVASVDIKPGSFPNSINLGNRGKIPVAILGSATFDVTQVNLSTVCFAGDCSPDTAPAFQDVNGDGFMDLVLHFNTQDTNLTSASTQGCVTGQLNNLMYFSGCDSVRIVP